MSGLAALTNRFGQFSTKITGLAALSSGSGKLSTKILGLAALQWRVAIISISPAMFLRQILKGQRPVIFVASFASISTKGQRPDILKGFWRQHPTQMFDISFATLRDWKKI